MSAKIIRVTHAREGEVVDICWTTLEGSPYWQRIQIPPKATRDAQAQEEALERKHMDQAPDLLPPETP